MSTNHFALARSGRTQLSLIVGGTVFGGHLRVDDFEENLESKSWRFETLP